MALDLRLELREAVERQRHDVGSPLIVPDFDQFRKLAAVDGVQPFEQFRLGAGLLADEKEHAKLAPGCELAGDKDLRRTVFDEVDQLVLVLEAHVRIIAHSAAEDQSRRIDWHRSAAVE